eukprot:GEMP01128617.1.p1 GENE.GEMP01128617.1~~GEMP01128617.1.p1  ORF type:complete len:112 (+),score=5.11 GEMP01128617.1:54-389(+)
MSPYQGMAEAILRKSWRKLDNTEGVEKVTCDDNSPKNIMEKFTKKKECYATPTKIANRTGVYEVIFVNYMLRNRCILFCISGAVFFPRFRYSGGHHANIAAVSEKTNSKRT